MRAAGLVLLIGGAALAGCRGPSAPESSRPVAAPSPRGTESAILGPARYLLMTDVGMAVDEGDSPARPDDYAILEGRRVVLSEGAIAEVLARPDDLVGFRSVPVWLGGGYVVWSHDQTFYGGAFEGRLEAIADVGAVGGARPWLDGMLLRSREGLYAFDVQTREVTRSRMPEVADAMAIEGGRAVRLDPWGRIELTVDGSTWRSPPGSPRAVALNAAHGGILVSGDRHDWLGPRSAALEPPPEPRPAPVDPMALPPRERPYASESARAAAFAGAILDPGRVLATHEGVVMVLDAATGAPVHRVLNGISQPSPAACRASTMAGDVLLSCTQETGAYVVRFEAGDPESARLEATFPAPGVFAGVEGSALAYEGRCGSESPSSADLLAAVAEDAPAESPSSDEAEIDGSDDEDGWLCARVARDRWVERRLSGPLASRLYRWIPAPDGEAVALVMAKEDDELASASAEGVRVVRVDPSKLEDMALPDRRASQVPARQFEDDFWIDDAGATRGWVELGVTPEEGGTLSGGPIPRTLPVVAVSGGPAAGITIGAGGRIEVHPTPEGVYAVVRGGRFAFAMGHVDDVPAAYETTDGGRSWQRVTAPVAGGLTEGALDPELSACTPIGCSWGRGVIRWGWGDRRFEPKSPSGSKGEGENGGRVSSSSANASRITLRCGDAPEPSTVTESDAHLVRGRIPADFSGQVAEPFLPQGRRTPVRASPVEGAEALAILPRGPHDPVGIAIRFGDGRLVSPDRLDATMLPGIAGATLAEIDGPVTAAYLPRGGVLAVVRGDELAELTRWPLLSDARSPRTDLARASDGRLGVAGYAVSSGDAWVAPLDVRAIELGPAIGLGSLVDLVPAGEGGCAAQTGVVWRFIAALPARLAAGEGEPSEVPTALFLIAGSLDAMCVEGVELALDNQQTVLVARFAGVGAGGGRGGEGAAWISGGKRTATHCELITAD